VTPTNLQPETHMLRQLLAPAVLLAAFAGAPAYAADEPGQSAAEREKWCQQNPAKCEELKARREEFCKKNPATCEQRRKKVEGRQAWCDANPGKCEEVKEERQERRKDRREKIKDKCNESDANKAQCEQLKQERDARRKERSDEFCAEHPEKCDGKKD